MRCRCVSRWVAGILLAVAACCTSRCAVAENVEKIVNAWSDLRADSRTVSYKMEGVSFTAQGALRREDVMRPREDSTESVRIEWIIDFSTQQFLRTQSFPYYDVTQEKHVPRDSTFVFSNGQTVEFIPVLSDLVATKQLNEPQVEFYKYPQGNLLEWDLIVLLAHGYAPINYYMACSDLGRSPDIRGLTIVGDAVDGEVPENVLVVRTDAVEGMPQTFSEYWVSPSRGYRIVRVLRHELGNITREFALQYVTDEGGTHISAAQVTSLLGPGHAVSENLTLKTVSFSNEKPLADAFVLAPQPAMWVYDAEMQHSYEYQPNGGTHVVLWVLIGVAIAMVGVALYFYGRWTSNMTALNKGD